MTPTRWYAKQFDYWSQTLPPHVARTQARHEVMESCKRAHDAGTTRRAIAARLGLTASRLSALMRDHAHRAHRRAPVERWLALDSGAEISNTSTPKNRVPVQFVFRGLQYRLFQNGYRICATVHQPTTMRYRKLSGDQEVVAWVRVHGPALDDVIEHATSLGLIALHGR
jgi:hypothetical protein